MGRWRPGLTSLLLPPLLLSLSCVRSGGPAADSVAPSGSPATASYAVGLRQLTFTDSSRITDPTPGQPGDETQGRMLPTTVWYPASGRPGAAASHDAPPAHGPFPAVVFSHGLLGVPGDYQAIATHWASAGFVVVAPTYPLTNRGARKVSPLDVVNQPADASFVLTSILHVATLPADTFHGLLDGGRVAAAGHSAGAITTVGLFNPCCRDLRLAAGVVLAGNSLGFGDHFAGPAVPVLFEHGDKDPIVPYWTARHTSDSLPWPKGLVTLEGQGHFDPYLQPDSPAFAVVAATTTDFFRWSLSGDRGALSALRKHAKVLGLAHLDDRL